MSKRIAIIFSAPDHRVAPDLLFWLLAHGFTERTMMFVNENRDGPAAAFNAGIILALKSDADLFVFAQNDLHPGPKTDAFLTSNKYHLQCVRYPVEGLERWNSPNAFHAGMWRASRASLTKLLAAAKQRRKDIFCHGHDANGFVNTCSCHAVPSLAKAACLSIGWVGDCGHFPRTPSQIPKVVVYSTAESY